MTNKIVDFFVFQLFHVIVFVIFVKLFITSVCGTEKNVHAGLVQFHMTILHISLENFLGTMALILLVLARILWLSKNTSSMSCVFSMFHIKMNPVYLFIGGLAIKENILIKP